MSSGPGDPGYDKVFLVPPPRGEHLPPAEPSPSLPLAAPPSSGKVFLVPPELPAGEVLDRRMSEPSSKRLMAGPQELVSAMKDIEPALIDAPTPGQLRDIKGRLREIGPLGAAQLERVDTLGQDLKSIKKATRGLARYAEEEGLPEGERYQELAQEPQGFWDATKDYVWSGARVFGEALDYVTHRPTRLLTAKALARPGEDPEKLIKNQVSWGKRVEEIAEEGNMVARGLMLLPEFAGETIGEVVGAGVTGIGVWSDWAADRPVDWGLIERTVKETKADTRTLFLLLETDWSTWTGLSASKSTYAVKGTKYIGTNANIARATMRVGRKTLEGGAKNKKIYPLLDEMQTLAPIADDPNIMQKIVPAFERAGLTADDAARAFGSRGEFFGADMPTFLPNEVPLLGALTRPVTGQAGKTIDSMLVKLGDKAGHITDPYVVRKMAQAAHRKGQDTAAWLGRVQVPGLNKASILARSGAAWARGYAPVFDLYDPNRRFLKTIRRVARASKTIREVDIMKRFERVADLAPADAERRMELVRRGIDPGWYPREGAKGFNRAKAEYKEFLGTLSKTERSYLREMQDFFDDIYRESVTAGYLKKNQLAKNPVTGKYFPRLYDNNYGLLVHLADVKKSPYTETFHLPTTDASRKGDLAIGDVGPEYDFVKKISDPHEAVPQYAARMARGEAAVWLEDQLVAQFGKELSAEGRLLFGKGVQMETPRGMVEVPTEMHEFLRGTLDNGFDSVARLLNDNIKTKGPVTKSVIAAFKAGSKVNNWWKKGVLVTRPAYHALNVLNDTTWMVMDGNTAAGLWIGNADRVMKGSKLGPMLPGVRKNLEENVDGIMRAYGTEGMTPWLDDPTAIVMKGGGDRMIPPSLRGPKKIPRSGGTRKMFPTEVRGGIPRAAPGKKLLTGQETAYRRALKGTLEDKIIFIARREGLPIETGLIAERLQLPHTATLKDRRRELQKMAEKGAKARGEKISRAPLTVTGGVEKALEGAGVILEHLGPLQGERIAKAWESNSKLAHFMWRLSRGDSSAAAATRSLETLLDYSDPGKLGSLLRWVLPFATWIARAPRAAARLTVRSPGRVGAPYKAMDVFGAPDRPDEPVPGRRIAERGKYMHFGEFGRSLLSKAVGDIPRHAQEKISQAVTAAGGSGDWVVENIIQPLPVPLIGGRPALDKGQDLPEGMGAVMLPREAAGEATNFPFEVIGLRSYAEDGSFVPNPNTNYVAHSVQPMLKMLFEMAMERDFRTGRKQTGTAGLFSSGFVVPETDIPGLSQILDVADEALKQVPRGRAGPEGLAIFSKHMLPWLIGNPMMATTLDNILFKAAGGEEAGATYGELRGGRPYIGPANAGKLRQQLRNINLFSPMPIHLTMPGESAMAGRKKIRAAKEAATGTLKRQKELKFERGY